MIKYGFISYLQKVKKERQYSISYGSLTTVLSHASDFFNPSAIVSNADIDAGFGSIAVKVGPRTNSGQLPGLGRLTSGVCLALESNVCDVTSVQSGLAD